MKYDTKVQKDTASSKNAKPEALDENKNAAAVAFPFAKTRPPIQRELARYLKSNTTSMLYGKKTANIIRKKRQSPLNKVFIGHQRTNTAKITRGRGRK